MWKLCTKSNWIYVHTFMQNPNDNNFLTTFLLIKDNVTTLWKLSISIFYFIAVFTNIRFFRQHPK